MRLRALPGVLLTCLVVMGLAAGASAARAEAPQTVLQDDALLLHGTPDAVRSALGRAASLGFDRVRLTAGWSVIAPSPTAATRPTDFDPTDPDAYPRDAWANLDRAVALTIEAGLAPMVDIGFWAPRWASAAQATDTGRLRTDVDPEQFAAFATAVARRYSGTWAPRSGHEPASAPAAPTPARSSNPLAALFARPAADESPRMAAAPKPPPLPRVDLFTLWNEPNHPGFLLPQWRQRDGALVPDSPSRYRAMVQAAYPAVKAAAPDARVLIGGTSSMGSSVPGRTGIPPLRFLRELACVDERLEPVTTGDCASFTTVPGDGWAHHPYSLRTRPDALPRDPDLLPVARTAQLAEALRSLVARGRLAPGDADLYLTEYGYETSPPDPQAFAAPAEQGRLLAWAESIASQVPAVRMWPQFLLQDRPGDPAGPRMRPFGDWQTGLLFADGSPKPAAAAYATPTFAQCRAVGRSQWTMVWGRLRKAAAGTAVTVETLDGGGAWRPATGSDAPSVRALRAAVARIASPGGSATRWLRGTPRQVRMVWTVDGGAPRVGPGVAPEPCPVARVARKKKHRRKSGRSVRLRAPAPARRHR
jgi:hypothetical protein